VQCFSDKGCQDSVLSRILGKRWLKRQQRPKEQEEAVPGAVMHTFNPRTQEVEAVGLEA
jgi:hypothetical protein